MNFTPEKYTAYPTVSLKDRTWPDAVIESHPVWCAVDLRDGNQALINPMNIDRKLKMYQLLVDIGIKEIEIGFPSSSQIEYDFARKLIEEELIPDDVKIQVLVQAREHLIRKTFESLKGARKAVIHMYNSTSVAQRRDVFRMDPKGIENLAVEGTKLIRDLMGEYPETRWIYQYSPESFTGTELEVALDICNRVIETYEPDPENKMIINLPSTVETSTPNVFADQIEWMSRNLTRRDSIILSVHTHNDRGTGIASTELALMAGAERVEGTLLGNGERTGNADIVTLGLNMYSQGIDPGLDLSNVPEIVRIVEECNQIETHVRHPYAGDLVFTALSGSHQDAIRKGLDAHRQYMRNHWDVPYLPIDPEDIGRTYETTIRINSQSGKGGIAYIIEREYGYKLPRALQIEFSHIIQRIADTTSREIMAEEIWKAFDQEYINQIKGFHLKSLKTDYLNIDGGDENEETVVVRAVIGNDNGEEDSISFDGEGNGPVNAFINGIRNALDVEFQLNNYEEHTLSNSSSAEAAAYISLLNAENKEFYGVGTDSNIVRASIKAILSAINRMQH